jgi:hypothetical protein
MATPRPLTAVGLGLAAGATGTLAMRAAQEAAGWLRSGSSATAATLKEPRTWAGAPPPAQVAKKVLGRRVTKRQAPLLANALQLGYGIGLGGAYGLAQSRLRAHPLALGALFGTAVWGLQYATLPPLGIHEPPWKHPPKTLAIDLGFYLAYGLGTAGAFRALAED